VVPRRRRSFGRESDDAVANHNEEDDEGQEDPIAHINAVRVAACLYIRIASAGLDTDNNSKPSAVPPCPRGMLRRLLLIVRETADCPSQIRWSRSCARGSRCGPWTSTWTRQRWTRCAHGAYHWTRSICGVAVSLA